MKEKRVLLTILIGVCFTVLFSPLINVYGEENNTFVSIGFKSEAKDEDVAPPPPKEKDNVLSPDKSRPVRPDDTLIQTGEVTNEFLVFVGYVMVMGVLLVFSQEKRKEVETA